MACSNCGRDRIYHGSEHQPMAEYGCHDGVLMDDDEHAEGWIPDTLYQPCRFNPKRCLACNGTGNATTDHVGSDDCPSCGGTGWGASGPQWPVSARELEEMPLASDSTR